MKTKKKPQEGKYAIVKMLRLGTAIVLIALAWMGCSKGDDGIVSITEPQGTDETDNGNNSSTDPEDPLGVIVTITDLDPPSPASLKFGDSIAVTYDYEVERPAGARIWIQPYSDGALPQSNSYSPSPVFKQKGTETVYVSVTEGDTVLVDQLKTQINTPGLILLGVLLSSDPLSESYEAVDYQFTN